MNFKYAKGVKAKWRVLFGKPDDLDPRYRQVLERKFLNLAAPQAQKQPTLAIRQYVTAQTIFSLTLLFIVALFEHHLKGVQMFLLSSFIIVSLVNSGAILDQRRWIFYLEYIRVLLVMIAIGVFYPYSWTFSGIAVALLIMVWYFRPIRRYYLKTLYTTAVS